MNEVSYASMTRTYNFVFKNDMNNIQGRELSFSGFEENMFIGMHLEAYKPISFKLGKMLGNTKL